MRALKSQAIFAVSTQPHRQNSPFRAQPATGEHHFYHQKMECEDPTWRMCCRCDEETKPMHLDCAAGVEVQQVHVKRFQRIKLVPKRRGRRLAGETTARGFDGFARRSRVRLPRHLRRSHTRQRAQVRALLIFSPPQLHL